MHASQESKPASPTAGRKPTARAVPPPTLADVALIDGPTAAAAGCMSLSTWHELVRTGAAPAPAIRQPRCTRWRLADVRAWLIEHAARGGNAQASAQVVAQAAKASAAAKRKRATATAAAAAQ
jgi:predicted DNA-binding transcriptional regulator AlpA